MSLCDSVRLGLASALLLGEIAVAVAAMHPHVSPAYRAFFIDGTADAWPPCQPDIGQVPIRGAIEPQKLPPEAACALLTHGWFKPEAWGVWNLGRTSKLSVPYASDDHTLILTLVGHVRPGRTQGVTVLVEGHEIGRFVLPDSPTAVSPPTAIPVPLPPATQTQVAIVELRIADPFSPIDQGDSSDARPLGVGLLRLDRIEAQQGRIPLNAP